MIERELITIISRRKRKKMNERIPIIIILGKKQEEFD